METIIIAIWGILIFSVINIIVTENNIRYKINRNRKSFYIMKVIYNNIIYRVLEIKIRSVQQSLYMGKCKYILKILKNGD
jgi:hypothetical protein